MVLGLPLLVSIVVWAAIWMIVHFFGWSWLMIVVAVLAVIGVGAALAVRFRKSTGFFNPPPPTHM